MTIRRFALAPLLTLLLAPAVTAADEPSVGRGDRPRPVLRIGAVAYSPDAVTIFEGIRRHCGRHGLPVDYVLYSNYDALVEALHAGHVDIAWNTPLAHARYHLKAGGKSQHPGHAGRGLRLPLDAGRPQGRRHRLARATRRARR